MAAPRSTNMMLGAPTWSDAATLTASSEITGFPVTNLQKQRPDSRFETVDGITSELSIHLDRGQQDVFNVVSLLYSNVTQTGSIRIRYADSLAEVTSNPHHDTAPLGPFAHFNGGTGTVTDVSWTFNTCTLECWFRVTADVTNRGIMRRGTGVGNSGIWLNALGQIVGGSVFSANDEDRVTSTTVVEVGTWYHVALAYNVSTNALTLIVNGVQEDTSTAIASPLFGDDTVQLATNTGGNRLHGDISCPRLWSKERSAAEVLGDYKTLLTGTEPSLEAAWQATSASGTTIPDAVGSNDMSLTPSTTSWGFREPFWSVADYPPWMKRHSLFTAIPVGVSASHMRIDIIDPDQTDGKLYFGRLVVGGLIQLHTNPQYGSSPVEWVDTSTFDRTVRGMPLMVDGLRKRRSSFQLRTQDLSDVALLNELYAARGRAWDVLHIFNPDTDRKTEGYFAQDMFTGVLAPGLSMRASHFGTWDSSWRVEEL